MPSKTKSSSNQWQRAPETLKTQFKTTMAEFSDAELRQMFGYPCCFLNNNMFTGLHQENWVLRLSPEDRDAFFQQYGTLIFEPMAGRVMREYVILPKKILDETQLLQQWLEKSLDYVRTLPPKITKKKIKKTVT